MSYAGESERGSKAALGAYFIIPLLACGLTIYYLVTTLDLVWEARATGFFIGAILLALCLAQFVRLGRRVLQGEGNLSFGDLTANSPLNRQRLALLLLVLTFIVTLPWVGTTPALFLVLMASMWVMGVRKIRTLVAVALTTAIVVHLLLIQLVGSRLPQGVLTPLFSLATGGA
jgi:hypothetical protein